MRKTKGQTRKKVVSPKPSAGKPVVRKLNIPKSITLTPKVNGIVIGCLEGHPQVQVSIASFLEGAGIIVPVNYEVRLTGKLTVEIQLKPKE